jgi:GNAT superfamily N-acetyltransferase
VRRDEYAGPEQLRAMQTLASRLHPDSSWRHAGDLAWAAAQAPGPDQSPTAVWRDGDSVLAWGWLEGPGELTLQVDPRYPALADEVLAWAEQVSPAPVQTTISDREPHIAAALTARGYRPAPDSGPFFVCLGFDLGRLPAAPPVLPDGYTLRDCDAATVALRAEAHRAAWSAWNSRYSEKQHTALRELWPYKAAFDVMALAPDGTPAAYCQGWYDEESRVGLFEPVGTDPRHRRLGLSRALGLTVLHRFAAAGGRLATVNPRGDEAYPDARLAYESMGFAPYSRTHTYSR